MQICARCLGQVLMLLNPQNDDTFPTWYQLQAFFMPLYLLLLSVSSNCFLILEFVNHATCNPRSSLRTDLYKITNVHSPISNLRSCLFEHYLLGFPPIWLFLVYIELPWTLFSSLLKCQVLLLPYSNVYWDNINSQIYLCLMFMLMI